MNPPSCIQQRHLIYSRQPSRSRLIMTLEVELLTEVGFEGVDSSSLSCLANGGEASLTLLKVATQRSDTLNSDSRSLSTMMICCRKLSVIPCNDADILRSHIQRQRRFSSGTFRRPVGVSSVAFHRYRYVTSHSDLPSLCHACPCA